MTAFTERFDREVSHSEEMKTYHVRVNGRLLTDDDKGKLLAKYEREMMKSVVGWYAIEAGIDSKIVPVFVQREGDPLTLFASFTKAKTHLAKALQGQTDTLRTVTALVRKLRKSDVLAVSVSDE